MWISKKKWNGMEKRIADLEKRVQAQPKNIGYQNPDILYFYGYVNGKTSQLIQHISQLNFLITSVEKEDKSKPPRRIGFSISTDSEVNRLIYNPLFLKVES